jgi:hypothetical protein
MHAMACDLDHLEKHIDWYGSVTAKTPDVWGQARLTSYRQETEQLLRNELDGFRVSQQGSISRTDIADLLVRLMFSSSTTPTTTGTAQANAEATKAAADATKAAAEAVSAADTLKRTSDDAARAVAEAKKAIAEIEVVKATALKAIEDAGKKPKVESDPKGIVAQALAANTALEPVRILEQKDRYLSYLNQLRRKNEGDDTSDAPGYSLNLVRIPVSLLPGKKTDRGYGAEMTFTITPILDDELLPNTFKELVVNDLLHLMAFPMTKLFSEADEATTSALKDDKVRTALLTDDEAAQRNYLTRDSTAKGRVQAAATAKSMTTARGITKMSTPLLQYSDTLDTTTAAPADGAIRFTSAKFAFAPMTYAVEAKGTRPIPPTLLPEVLGTAFLYEILRMVQKTTQDGSNERGGFVHMPEVQAVLREHLIAAYRFLARPESRPLWDTFCTPDLVDAVRSRKQDWLESRRKEFRKMVRHQSGTPYLDALDPNIKEENKAVALDRLVHFSATSGLAWAILVDSALLNVRLMEDMKRTGSTLGGIPPCEWPTYYLPDPSVADRQAFNEYVKRRWPIHVFTLDPATDEQNLTDSLTTVRNTQLALSLAFLRGQMSTNAFVNATRKVQSQYETIGLNRTQVGFAHGDNTFGWRFYPRFQTPPVRGNLQTFIGGNLLGINTPRDGIRTRELEPGPRECVAVVLMPSFVPNAMLDATGNWFALANPKHKVFDHTQALRLSRTVQAIRTDGCGVKDAHKYRDDDQRLLMARAEQLSARLPMQAMRFQVPTVNSYGGFELFGNATTDLAPELYGWYGAPGLRPGTDPTTLFLVGDHFSVNHTKIVVGNVEVMDYKMLSRQVMKVTVPAGALTLPADWAEKDDPHVHIHIATPYGVSRALEIPLVCNPAECRKKTAAAVAQATVPTTATIVYDKNGAGNGKIELANPRAGSSAVAWLQWPSEAAPAQVWVELRFQYKDCPLTVRLPEAVTSQGNLVPLKKKELDQIVTALFGALKPYGPFTDESNPLTAGFTTEAVTLIPSTVDGKPDRNNSKGSATQLGLTFNCRIPVPEVTKSPPMSPPSAAPMQNDGQTLTQLKKPKELLPEPESKQSDPTIPEVPVIKLKGLDEILQVEPAPQTPPGLPPASREK